MTPVNKVAKNLLHRGRKSPVSENKVVCGGSHAPFYRSCYAQKNIEKASIELENLTMKLGATKRSQSRFQHIHQSKILSRRRLIRARSQGKKIADTFCLAQLVAPKILKQPLDFSQVCAPEE